MPRKCARQCVMPQSRIDSLLANESRHDSRLVFHSSFLVHARLTVRSDFHWLRVTEGKDFLYSGGGATKDDFFGYLGLPANGHRQIGYLADIALTYRALDFLTLYAYYGHVFGQDVIHSAFVGRDANYGYVETTIAF